MTSSRGTGGSLVGGYLSPDLAMCAAADGSIGAAVADPSKERGFDVGSGATPEHPLTLPILPGSAFEPHFRAEGLPRSHPFHWDTVSKNPKGDHGTFSVRWMQTVTYHLLHSNGFLRMATERGRVYWLAQNETLHTTPDWKIHFSIAPRGQWEVDIGHAWNILAGLFIERCCEVGMKAKYSPWIDKSQRGRELTVYVYVFAEEFNRGHPGGPMSGLSPRGEEHLHHLGPEFEAYYVGDFWTSFIREADDRLLAAGLQSAGVADGDLPVPGSSFASIRNEAYVKIENESWVLGDRPELQFELAYPPNRLGWNAAQHPNPLEQTLQHLAAEC